MLEPTWVLLWSLNKSKQKIASWLSFYFFLYGSKVHIRTKPFIRRCQSTFFFYFRFFTFCTNFTTFLLWSSRKSWITFCFQTYFIVCFYIGARMWDKCSITWFTTKFCKRKSQIQRKSVNLKCHQKPKTKKNLRPVLKNSSLTEESHILFAQCKTWAQIWTS